MKIGRFTLLALVLALTGAAALPADAARRARAKGKRAAVPLPPLPEALPERLRAIVDRSGVPAGSLGLSVIALDGMVPASVVEHRPDEAMVPASNVKLLSTAAALVRLGEDYRFRTSLRADGAIADGVLTGDLVVVGRGDPGISGRYEPDHDPLATFRVWAKALRAAGIGRVTGRLLVDDLAFDRVLRGPEWPPVPSNFWYFAPVSALSFQDNCVGIRVRPGGIGQPAAVSLVPPTTFFRVEGTIRTAKGTRRRPAGFAVGRTTSSDAIRVAGSVAPKTRPEIRFLTVDDPAIWFGSALLDVLREEGIAVGGGLVRPDRPTGSPGIEIARHETPLPLALATCNRRSQNLFAELFVKTLGLERRGEGSWPAGILEIEDALVDLGLPKGSYRIDDGSGISRTSRLSAGQLTTLLVAMSRRPEARVFADSLCEAGDAGCGFGKRFVAPPGARISAKTGTLVGVRTLSGYVTAVGGARYAYSILANAPFPEGAVARLQEALLRTLAERG